MICISNYRYKERLNWKYIHSINKSSSLNRNKWRFIPSNVDDFRSGIPAKSVNQTLQEVSSHVLYCIITFNIAILQ